MLLAKLARILYNSEELVYSKLKKVSIKTSALSSKSMLSLLLNIYVNKLILILLFVNSLKFLSKVSNFKVSLLEREFNTIRKVLARPNFSISYKLFTKKVRCHCSSFKKEKHLI